MRRSLFFENRYYANNFIEKEMDESILSQVERQPKFSLNSLIPDLKESLLKRHQKQRVINQSQRSIVMLNKNKWEKVQPIPDQRSYRSIKSYNQDLPSRYFNKHSNYIEKEGNEETNQYQL
eukprot:403331683